MPPLAPGTPPATPPGTYMLSKKKWSPGETVRPEAPEHADDRPRRCGLRPHPPTPKSYLSPPHASGDPTGHLVARNAVGDSWRPAGGSTHQLGSVTEPPKARTGRALSPAVLFCTFLQWGEDLARAAQRGHRTNDEIEAGEKERRRATGLITKVVTPHGKVPQRDCSEGTVWDKKGHRLVKSELGGHGEAQRSVGGGPRVTGEDTEGQTGRILRPSPRVRPSPTSTRSWGGLQVHLLAKLTLTTPLSMSWQHEPGLLFSGIL